MRLLALLALWLPAIAVARLNVVTTTPDLAAIAREVGGEHVTVRSLGRPNENPHFVEPKPSYIVALNNADVLIEVGLDLEVGWLPALLEQTRNRKIQPGQPGRLNASTVITPLEVAVGPVDRSHGDVHPHGNPHYLLDPECGKLVGRAMAATFARLDPAHAPAYDQRLAAFRQRVDNCLAGCRHQMERWRGEKVFTYHRSFSYFAERFGLEVVNTVEPKPGIPPSPAHITRLIEQGQRENVRAILMENWYDRRVPDLIASKTGARVVPLALQTNADYADFIRTLVEQVAAALP
jgi:zinc/manganese transport system substrate-binding protein